MSFTTKSGKTVVKRKNNNIRSIVKKAIQRNQETMVRTTVWSGTNITDAVLSNFEYGVYEIDQGDSQRSRHGNQITITKFTFNGFLTLGDAYNVVRAVLFIPRNTSSSLVTDGLEVDDAIDLDKYTVLHDKLYFITAGRNVVPINITKIFNKGNRRGLKMIYKGATGSSDIEKNKMSLYLVSDSGAISHPQLSGVARTFFKDA